MSDRLTATATIESDGLTATVRFYVDGTLVTARKRTADSVEEAFGLLDRSQQALYDLGFAESPKVAGLRT